MSQALVGLLGLSLVVAVAATYVGADVRVMRRRVASSLVAFAAVLTGVASRHVAVSLPIAPSIHGAWFEITSSRTPFLLTLAFATSAIVITAPTNSIGIHALRRTLLGFIATLFLLASTNLVVLGFASLVVIVSVHADVIERSTSRVARGEARLAGFVVGISGAAAVATAARAVLATDGPYSFDSFQRGVGSLIPAGISFALIVTNLVRLAPFPFHAWLPITLDRASVGPASIALLSQPAAMLVLHEAFPHALRGRHVDQGVVYAAAGAFVLAGAFSATVGLVQHEARRAIGYVVSSQNALAIAGIVTGTLEGGVASVLFALGGALTGVGLLLVTHGVEARAGRVDALDSLGLARPWPRLGAAFLLLALSTIGFPGSIQFFAEDLLLQGLLAAHPIAAYSVLVVAVLNGITMLRLFFGQFFGPGKRLTGDEYVAPDMLYTELAGPFGLAGLMAALVLVVPTISAIIER